MTLLDFVRLTRHAFWLIVTAALLGLLGAALFSFLQPTLYQSSSRGYVVAGGSETVGGAGAAATLAERKATSYAPLVNTQRVRDLTAQQLAGAYPQGARYASMRATGVEGTNLFSITVTAPSPQEAKDVADAAMVAVADEALRLDSMDANGQSTGESVVRLVPTEKAALNPRPVSPDWLRNLAIGLVVGLALGYAAAFVQRSIDSRVRQQSDVEEVMETSVLGILPKVDEFADGRGNTRATEGGISAEAMRQLRTNLRFVSVDDPPRALVVTSANPSEGKSTVAANLAEVLARAGSTVTLVDADLRRPTQAKRMGLDRSIGLSQVLAGDVPWRDVVQPTATEGLSLLASGRIPPNPSELVGSQRMRQLVDEMKQHGLVIIDAPPILPVTDAGLLTDAADGAIVVVKVGSTQKEQARQAAKLLRNVNGRILGAVLNMTPKRAMGTATYGYGYGGYGAAGYGSDYSAAPQNDEASAPRKRGGRARRSR